MKNSRIRVFLTVLATLMFLSVTVALSDDIAMDCPSGKLRQRYGEIRDELQHSPLGLPLVIRLIEDKKRLSGDVYSLLDHPFEKVKGALSASGNWCDILMLHFNIKACDCADTDMSNRLTIYYGRKFYQAPDDDRRIQYVFQSGTDTDDYFEIALAAEKGPFLTRDYRIDVQAVRVEDGHTFMRLSYGFTHGLMAKAALKTYLATIGRDKVGFTEIGRDRNGDVTQVRGIAGMIERNSVRYHFAVQAYLDSLAYEPSDRFEARLGRWFDLTALFPHQLYEMSREEYIRCKLAERGESLPEQAAPRIFHE